MEFDELTEIEVFRMAVRLAEASLNNVPNALTVVNPEDVIHDRIIQCHSAISRAADDLLNPPKAGSH